MVVCDAPRSLEPGRTYLAPDGAHLRLRSPGSIGPEAGPPRGFQRPSADELFESAALSHGPRAIAVQLTGMGRDGAEGALAIERSGGLVVAQESATCVVPSMPRAVIDSGAAHHVLPPEGIAALLATLAAGMAADAEVRG